MSHIDEGRLHAYLDGALAERQRQEVEAHVASCAECRERLEKAAAISSRAADLLADLEPSSVQPPAWREIEERAAARGGTAAPRRWVRPSIAWAASIALAFGVGWFTSSYWAGLPAGPDALSRSPESISTVREAPEAELEGRGIQVDAEDLPQLTPFREAQSTEDRFDLAPRPAASQERGIDEAGPGAPSRVGENEGAEIPTTVPPQDAAEPRARAGEFDDTRQEKAAPPAEAYRVVPPQVTAAPDQARADRSALERAADPDKRTQPAALTERSPEANPVGGLEAQGAALRDSVEEEAKIRFFAVQPEDAAVWLGGELRTLPELNLRRVEVGPGSAIDGGLAGLPAVKLIYEDAAGSQLILVQQLVGGPFAMKVEEPALRVEPVGIHSYRWHDSRGYRLILQGAISGDSLRALADRVR